MCVWWFAGSVERKCWFRWGSLLVLREFSLPRRPPRHCATPTILRRATGDDGGGGCDDGGPRRRLGESGSLFHRLRFVDTILAPYGHVGLWRRTTHCTRKDVSEEARMDLSPYAVSDVVFYNEFTAAFAMRPAGRCALQRHHMGLCLHACYQNTYFSGVIYALRPRRGGSRCRNCCHLHFAQREKASLGAGGRVATMSVSARLSHTLMRITTLSVRPTAEKTMRRIVLVDHCPEAGGGGGGSIVLSLSFISTTYS